MIKGNFKIFLMCNIFDINLLIQKIISILVIQFSQTSSMVKYKIQQRRGEALRHKVKRL